MSDYWKLDIKDYTIAELDDMFNLTAPYTLAHIVNADNDLTERIKTDGSIDDNKKQQILRFLSQVKEKLIQAHKKDMAQLKKLLFILKMDIWYKKDNYKIILLKEALSLWI